MGLIAKTNIIHNGKIIRKGEPIIVAGRGVKDGPGVIALPGSVIGELIDEGAIEETVEAAAFAPQTQQPDQPPPKP